MAPGPRTPNDAAGIRFMLRTAQLLPPKGLLTLGDADDWHSALEAESEVDGESSLSGDPA